MSRRHLPRIGPLDTPSATAPTFRRISGRGALALPQVDYARAVAKALSTAGFRGWKTEPMLVAEDFSVLVLDDARVAARPRGVEVLRCRAWDGSKLTSPQLRI